MATFTTLGNGKVRAQIRRAGQPSIAKTWDTLKLAKEWARLTEATLDAGKKAGVHGQTGMSFGDACDRYIKEKGDISKTAVCIIGNLKEKLGKIRLQKISEDDIVGYIVNKKFGSPMSGSMHFSFFGTILKMAKFGWKYHVPEILEHAKGRLEVLELIGGSKARTRRPTLEELELLFNYKFPTDIPMNDIIRFAVSSAMRQAEITRIERTTLNTFEKTIVITDRKHPTKKKGNHQTVPLLPESLEIIKRQKHIEGDDRIFPYAAGTVGTYFTLACKQLGIVDLHFHDLRHEAASRLFEMGYQIHEVALFTGHTNWKMLQRYTHLKPKNLRSLEGMKSEEPQTQMDAETAAQFKMFQAMMATMKQGEAA
jgi:hypothetical protein